MKLLRLRLSGFKTFARDTEVLFDRGITAIVGPNGSGKSNLVDAVRWALGETNARELRGQRMDEVIYAGGSGRSRLGLATVELVLDNEQGRLPLEDAEISLERRVVRGAGDTEYRLNGDRVRLRDVERLLTATGLTQSGYAVVAQNDIDAIIEASPAHRRMLVEQAAGVRHLRAAGDEALVKVARGEAVIRRLDDLLEDAEPRLAELAEQAGVAREQRSLAERLSELRGSLAREEWRAARGRLRQAMRARDHAATKLEAAEEAERAFAVRIDTGRGGLTDARRAHASALERLEAARLGAERAAGEHRRYSDRLRAAARQRAVIAAELRFVEAELSAAATAADSRLAGLRRDLHARDETAQRATSDLGVAEAALQAARSAADEAGRARRDAEARADELRQAVADAVSQVAAVRGTLSGLAGGEGGVARAVAAGRLSAKRLWDCVAAPAHLRIAAEAALEPYIGAWVVADATSAAAHLDPGGTREQLLAADLEVVLGAPISAPGQDLFSALEVEASAAGAVSRCLRRIWLAPDMSSARRAIDAGATAAVLADGTVVTEAGIRGGGRPGRVLALAADERRLSAHAESARSAEAAATEEAAAARELAIESEKRLVGAAEVARTAQAVAAEAGALAQAARAAAESAEAGADESAGLVRAALGRCEDTALRLAATEAEALAALVGLARRALDAERLRASAESEQRNVDATATPLRELERALEALEAERTEVAVLLARAQDEHAATAAVVAACEAELRDHTEALAGDSEEDVEAFDAQALERAEREIVRLERRVAALGAVNALAPEQHDALTQRVSHLLRDRADLGAACSDIRELVGWLTKHLDDRFDAIFGAVSFHFHQLFSELFPGGKAALRMEEVAATDLEDGEGERRAGVEILAQPPGKRLGPLRLLSGGERALTALSVILALQQVNPSPFYIFDEVDAALDDTNVLRFVRLVQRLAAEQQFVVVTHNHITMAAADSLWGVTIDSEGVSTVIGVRFDERAGPTDAATTLPQPVAAHAG